MLDINWIDITLIASALPSLIIMLGVAYRANSLSNLFFGLAILSFLIGLTLGYFSQIDADLVREWGDLISITLVLCGLFVKIRNSKPVFARFPIAMTMLPLIGIFFYPMIIDAEVVKDLLTITYQGGAIIVACLVVSINHIIYKQRSLLIIACLVFLFSYVGYWFIDIPEFEQFKSLSVIMMGIGMFIGAIGLRKVSKLKINNLQEG